MALLFVCPVVLTGLFYFLENLEDSLGTLGILSTPPPPRSLWTLTGQPAAPMGSHCSGLNAVI